MNMYKTIFVTDAGESAGEQRFTVDGNVALTTAFATLEEAVGAISGTEAGANSIVVTKVASGKYDNFSVVVNGEVVVQKSTNFVAVNFGGTTTTVDGEEITVAAVPNTLDQAAVLADLNRNVATGSCYVAAEDALFDVLAPTLYVGMVDDQYAVVSNTEVAKAPNLDSLFEIINNIATLTVDPTYTAEIAGYGETKFSSFTAALQKAAESDKYNHIKVAGSLDEIMPTDIEFIVNNNIVIDADKPVTINLKNNGTSYDLVLDSNNNNTITFGANVTLKLDDRVIWAGYNDNDVDVVIKGTVSGKQWWNGADTTVEVGGKLISSGEAMVLRRGATLTVNGDAAKGAAEADRTVQLDANYFSMLAGNLVANNTLIQSGAVWVGNTGGYANEGGVAIELNNTIMNSAGNFKLQSAKSATMTLTNGSVLNIKDTHGYGKSIIDANSALNVTDGSSATVNKGINNAGSINVSDGVLTVNGTVDNTGSFIVSGKSSIKVDKLTSIQLIAFGDMDADRTELSLGSASGKGMTIDGKRINLYNADVTLTDSITANLGDDFLYFKEAKLDLNGKELNLNTGKMILNGIDINGTGTINAIDSNDPVCVQNLTANIGEGVTFNAHTFHAYADTNVAGDLNVTNTVLVGADGIDPADNKTPWIDNADMTVTGSLTTNNMEVRGASGDVVASKLIVDGGEVNVSGTLTNNGTFIIAGESKVQVEELLGTKAIRTADGATLVDSSYIKGNNGTPTLRALGDLEIAGDFTLGNDGNTNAFFKRDSNDVAADLTIGKTLTVNIVLFQKILFQKQLRHTCL